MGLFKRIMGGDPEPCTPERDPGARTGEKAPADCPPPRRIRIPLNKTTTEVKVVMEALIFPCPICEVLNTIPFYDLDPLLGGEVNCQNCQVVLHIPGGYTTRTEVRNLKIYAGLPVAIRKFPLFYFNHPTVKDLDTQGISRIIIQYGLWGFCQRCNTRFTPAVLLNLPQQAGEIIQVRSLTSEEVSEMRYLRQGQCPYCGHRVLMVIISDIPHYVISASENLSHRWEED